jgi:hypothetical protein
MGFRSAPVAVGTSDTDIFEMPATLAGAIVLGINNVSGSARTYTVKFYKQSEDVTITIASAVAIAANVSAKFPYPLAMETGDVVIVSASAADSVVAFGTIVDSDATPAAVGFVPRGEWSDAITYDTNDLVRVAADGKTYVSMVDTNLNNEPNASPAQWMIYVSDGEQGTPGLGDLLSTNNLTDLASPKSGLDNIMVKGADVASASTVDLDAATGELVDITGTTTITAITLSEGRQRTVRAAGAFQINNGASLVLPGGGNIVAAVGDFMVFRGYAGGVVRCVNYVRSSGHPLTTAGATIASAATTELGSTVAESINISGTTTITSFGSTAPTGAEKTVQFQGALTLTHNGTSLIIPGAANITTAAGDVAIVRHEGSGNWRLLTYTRAAGRPLNSGVTDTLSKGFSATSVAAGTKSSGTFTPAAADGNFQHATNGGAHTLAPPSTVCSIIVEYTNNASAGAVTTSGFTKVTGDTYTTTNGHKFLMCITKTQTYSHLHIQALQ